MTYRPPKRYDLLWAILGALLITVLLCWFVVLVFGCSPIGAVRGQSQTPQQQVTVPLDALIAAKDKEKDKTDYTALIILSSSISVLPPTILAFATLLSSLRNTRKQDEAKVELVKIHTQTNTHLSQLTADLNAERARNRGLEEKVNALVKANDEKQQLAMKMAGQPPRSGDGRSAPK